MGAKYSLGRFVYYNQVTDNYLKCRKNEDYRQVFSGQRVFVNPTPAAVTVPL